MMQTIEKVATGIPGLDFVAKGGLPKGRSTLVAGQAGSAKSVFAAQFLAGGITSAVPEPGVFVTFEESPADIRLNMAGLGWDIARWEAEGRWAFVDASPGPGPNAVEVGSYDLTALVARIEGAVKRIGARRVSIDSIGSIFAQLEQASVVRAQLLWIGQSLKRLGVTAVITAEADEGSGGLCRHGIEEYVADNVIVLGNTLAAERRRRTIEILKFRGTDHHKGVFPLSVLPDRGIAIVPLAAVDLLAQRSTSERVSSGSADLDAMCGGGFYRDSTTFVSGGTGTGKTLLVAAFLAATPVGESSLLFAFEESREQLLRNAAGCGIDLAGLEAAGRVKLLCAYPEVATLEDHLIRVKDAIEEFRPSRLAFDSLSAIERIATPRAFREFAIGLSAFVKVHALTALLTATTPTFLGGVSVAEQHVSTLTDTIILLRYVECRGDMQRGIMVLKMRGSPHEKSIRAFTIDERGLRIGEPFRTLTGVLSGSPVHAGEDDRAPE